MNHKNVASRTARVAGTSAVLAAAIALLAQGSANADVFVKLPTQTDSQTLSDGTKVTITRTGETAVVSPSLGGTPLHRSAQVSARYQVQTSQKATIKIQAGYIVGCQVSITGGGANGTGNSTSNATTAVTTTGGGGGASLALAAGQAQMFYITDVEKADGFGEDYHTTKVSFKTKNAKLSYINSQIQLTGCAGYAQARSYASTLISTPNVDQIVVTYGKPFSIG